MLSPAPIKEFLRFAHSDDRLDLIEGRITASLYELRGDLTGAFEHELRSFGTTIIFGLVSMVLTMAALAVALVRLT